MFQGGLSALEGAHLNCLYSTSGLTNSRLAPQLLRGIMGVMDKRLKDIYPGVRLFSVFMGSLASKCARQGGSARLTIFLDSVSFTGSYCSSSPMQCPNGCACTDPGCISLIQ